MKAIALAGALIVGAAASALAAPATPSKAPGVVFASPTVVNEFAPGYEPDVIQDQSATATRGDIYSSWPNGFSTTISFLDRSNDNGASFHPTEGSVAGKPLTCVGGGDSELQQDNHDGELLFNDLQGLTNFSTSSSTNGFRTVSTTCVGVKSAGVDRQWVTVDDNAGTSSIGSGPNDGRAYLFYDTVAQNLKSPGGNGPVVNVSTDGINYGGCADAAASVCQLAADQISGEDDIVGNAFLDDNPKSPRYHEVYEVRGSSDSGSVLLSSCRGAAPGKPTTAALTAGHCAQTANEAAGGGADPNWTDHTVFTLPKNSHEKSFIVGDVDTAGNIYVVWAQYPYAADGQTVTGDGKVQLAYSKDGGLTWSAPRQLNPPSQHTVIFPWIAAGDPGRVAIVWYGTPQASYKGFRGPDGVSSLWDVELADSTNALSASPTYALSTVSDHHVKFGNISTGGLGGANDRSLGDFLQVKQGLDGKLIVSYVDDTSGNRNADVSDGSGETPPEAAGPTMVAHQIGGPSLLAKVGDLGAAKAAVGSVADPINKGYPDAFLSSNGIDTSAPKILDIGGVSVTKADATHLSISLKTAQKDLAENLSFSPLLGGLYANFNVRWAARYGTAGNDGQIYYVGMQLGQDGVPQYYVGSTSSIDSTRTKYFAYPTVATIPGSISGDTIQWTVPLSLIGSPKVGDHLWSVTGFTSTQATPNQAVITHVPTGGQVGNVASPVANLIDASPSFSYEVGSVTRPVIVIPPVIIPPVVTPPGGSHHTGPGGKLASTGLGVGLPALALALLALALWVRRRRTT